MNRTARVGALLAMVSLLVACSDSGSSLLLDVRSDLIAGVEAREIDAVLVTAGDAPVRKPLDATDDLVAGVRVLERRNLTPGTYAVQVSIVGNDGLVWLSRNVRVEVEGTTGITVVLSRTCRGIVCPDAAGDPEATECVAAMCVRPECDTPDCTRADCTTSSDCPAPAAACAQALCVSGSCLSSERLGGCGMGEVCNPDVGCVGVVLPDAGVRDAGPRDAGLRDGGPIDASGTCPGECTPGVVEEAACGNCGLMSRTCGPRCVWGPFGACGDSDSRCTASAPSCINDYCWGWRPTDQAAFACLDMATDYAPGAAFGVLAHDVYGRPGARWTKENRHESCPAPLFMDAESGTLDASGYDRWSFEYGATSCTEALYGRWSSRIRIDDVDGSTFTLPNPSDLTYFRSGCALPVGTCMSSQSYCP